MSDKVNGIIFVIGFLMGGGIVFLIGRLWLGEKINYMKGEAQRLLDELKIKENKIEERTLSIQYCEKDNNELRLKIVKLENELESNQKLWEEKINFLKRTEEDLMMRFKDISEKVLDKSNENFLSMAATNFDKLRGEAKEDLEKRQIMIQYLIEPLQKVLKDMNNKVDALEKERVGAYVGITEQLKYLVGHQNKLESETVNLVKALRMPQSRGRWGEMQLKRTVELAGMLDHVDFYEQVSFELDQKIHRPDMLVHLPNDRVVAIDAKVPLSAYLESFEQDDLELQKEGLKRHARHIRDHIMQLSAKAYWKQFEYTVEFVVLFLPGESFFSSALQEDPDLIDFGVSQKVIIGTPTTLIALLKSIAYGWQQESITKQAKQIAQLGRELYERMYIFGEHFGDMKRSLDKVINSYNKAVNSMESRLLPVVRKFKDLHVSADQEIPELKSIEQLPLSVKAEELCEIN